MQQDQISVPRLWTHRDTAAYLQISIAGLYGLGARGEGPRWYMVGGQRRYDPTDVRAWLSSRAAGGEAA